jgi:hypothetical protein
MIFANLYDMQRNHGSSSADYAMEKNRIHSRHIIDEFMLKVEIARLDQNKERVVDVLTRPAMWLGVVSYVLAMWLLERNDEAAR